VDAAVQTLRQQLNTAIGNENALHTDFQLPTVPTDRIMFGGTPLVAQYPTVEVAVPDIDGTGLSLGQVGWDTAPEVMVQAWLDEQPDWKGAEGLYRAILRLGRAVFTPLIQPGAFYQGAAVQRFSVRHRMNPQNRDAPRLHAAVLLLFTLEDSESRL
jgi:hypothetical protein